MQLFRHENRQRSDETKRVYAYFELAHTLTDFAAAIFFLAGSVLFFWQATETTAIWLFVIGSFLFAVKPTLRMARELRLLRMGDVSKLEQAEENEP